MCLVPSTHHPDYVPGLEYPKYLASLDDDIPIEYQRLPADSSSTTLVTGYIVDSDPDEDLEEDPEDVLEEDPANYLVDGGDKEEEEESSGDDADDEDEKEASEESYCIKIYLHYILGKKFYVVQFRRTSLTGFPAQSVRSSNAYTLDSPYLLVLVIGTSQSRQHDKSESDSHYLSD
ncbi:hypothetical protein Tco_0576686 [Tanacetum coccineum]